MTHLMYELAQGRVADLHREAERQRRAHEHRTTSSRGRRRISLRWLRAPAAKSSADRQTTELAT